MQIPKDRYDYFDTQVSLGLDGTIYIGTFSGYLCAFRPDQTLKWKCHIGGGIHTRPALASDGTVYVGAFRYVLCAVDPNGKVKWEFPASVCERGAATVGPDGTVSFHAALVRDRAQMDQDFNLFALHPDGTERWRIPLGGSVQQAQPLLDAHGDIVIRSGNHRLFAVDSAGRIKWSFDGVSTEPVLGTTNTFIVGCTNGTLAAVDRDGRVRWSVPIQGGVSSPATVAQDGTIYVGSGGGWLVALNAHGEVLWQFETDGGPGLIDYPGPTPRSTADLTVQLSEYLKDHPHRPIRQPPVVDGKGTVMFAAGGQFLYALNPRGDLAWKIDVKGSPTKPLTLSPAGVIYCVDGRSFSSMLYAINTRQKVPAPSN